MSEDRIRWGVDSGGQIVQVESIGNSYRKPGVVWMKGEDCPTCGHGWWEHGKSLESYGGNEKIRDHLELCGCTRLRGQSLPGGTGLRSSTRYFKTREAAAQWFESQIRQEIAGKLHYAEYYRTQLSAFQKREGRATATLIDPLETLYQIRKILESSLLEPPSKIREARRLLQGLEEKAA